MKNLRKNFSVKVVLLDGSKVVRNLRAPAGKLITDKGVDQVLEDMGSQVEQAFPGREFRLVPLRDGNFNFVEIASAADEGPDRQQSIPSTALANSGITV